MMRVRNIKVEYAILTVAIAPLVFVCCARPATASAVEQSGQGVHSIRDAGDCGAVMAPEEELRLRTNVWLLHQDLLPIIGPDEYVPEFHWPAGYLTVSICRLVDIEQEDLARATARLPRAPFVDADTIDGDNQ